MNFGQALEELKKGFAITRDEYLYKDGRIHHSLVLIPGSTFPVTEGRPLATALPVGTQVTYSPYIDIVYGEGILAGGKATVEVWTATNEDILAEDWLTVPL